MMQVHMVKTHKNDIVEVIKGIVVVHMKDIVEAMDDIHKTIMVVVIKGNMMKKQSHKKHFLSCLQ